MPTTGVAYATIGIRWAVHQSAQDVLGWDVFFKWCGFLVRMTSPNLKEII